MSGWPEEPMAMARSAAERLRIIVQGYVIRWPLGGMVWSNMHYLLGLMRLGHDVCFIEDSTDEPLCLDPSRNTAGADPGYGLAFARRLFDRIGVGPRWAYWDQHTGRWLGPAAGRMPAICRDADLLLNLAGVNPIRPWLEQIPHRCLVDEDPAFTQVCNLTLPERAALSRQHTSFLSFGENIGRPDCMVPDDGLGWVPTRQPLDLDVLRVRPPAPDGAYTTVMKLDSYVAREYHGVRYGLKSESMRALMSLPERAGVRLELAASGPAEAKQRLRDAGFALVDPRPVSRDPWTYEDYIAGSKAELGVAKHGYVVSNSGWFSERTCAYLGMGRPAIVEDTGFSSWLPAGDGVLPFHNADEALAAIEDVEARYEHHCRAARDIAETYFDHRDILPRMLADAMTPASSRKVTP